jgi:23S rRNA (pseudouridine1915-N3)-methyltransferase
LFAVWACGGIGIRVRLRSVSRKGWEFESPHAHTVCKLSALMKLLFLFAGGKYDAEILSLAESFVMRISRYENMETVLLSEKKDSDDMSMLKRIHQDDCVVLFDERGKMCSSENFAMLIDREKQKSTRRIVFVVGGAHGVGDEMRKRAGHVIAFSPMVFPHQLARVMVLEQVYRALSILTGSKYHHGST